MLNNILIIIILLSIISNFIAVKFWRKKYFVKELYHSEGASVALFIITIVITIGIIIAYFLTSKTPTDSWFYLSILLLLDLLLLCLFSISATTCIYLKNEILIYKNIFCSKQILIDKNTQLIVKIDKKIIKSSKKTISISVRQFYGNINNLMHNIEILIKQSNGNHNHGDGSLIDN